jgi:hypothetical protein
MSDKTHERYDVNKEMFENCQYYDMVTFYGEKMGLDKYEICKEGAIRNKKTKTILNVFPGKDDGYVSVGLTDNLGIRLTNKNLHIYMAIVFLPNDDNKEFVNHRNRIRHDNRLKNLEWVTHSENMEHARDTQHLMKDQKIPTGTPIFQLDIKTKETIKTWKSIILASTKLKLDYRSIQKCCNRNFHSNSNHHTSNGYVWIYSKCYDKEGEIWIKYPKSRTMVSNYGRFKTSKITFGCNHCGYKKIRISGKTIFAHIAVATLFIKNDDPINKSMVNHIDANKLNNKVENLEWVTPSENSRHASKMLLLHNKPVIQKTLNGDIIKIFDSGRLASEETGIQFTVIKHCSRGYGQNDECIFTAGGYVWDYLYEDLYNKKVEYHKSKGKKMITRELHQYDKDWNFIDRFESAVEASNKIEGITLCMVRKSLEKWGIAGKKYRFAWVDIKLDEPNLKRNKKIIEDYKREKKIL